MPGGCGDIAATANVCLGDTLDDAAEDLDRAAVVRALDALARRARQNADGADKRKRDSQPGAYGRAAFAWTKSRGWRGARFRTTWRLDHAERAHQERRCALCAPARDLLNEGLPDDANETKRVLV
jgi:hypothetical protein